MVSCVNKPNTSYLSIYLSRIMGLPLLDWIFTREETTEAECAVLVKQVVMGLEYLHSCQVSYLDLKVFFCPLEMIKGST